MSTADNSSVSEAIRAIGRGDIVIVTDNEDRENEGDFIVAAEAATEDKIAFFLQHTSGLICVGMDASRCEALSLSDMVSTNTDPKRTAFTVSVDAKNGVGTGISASDRAKTLRDLVDGGTGPDDFTRPGHIFPLRARAGGVLARAGHTEAAADLTRLAGCAPGGALCEVVSRDKRTMATRDELDRLANEYSLHTVTIAALVRYRLQREQLVVPTHSARIPTRFGDFECKAWTSRIDGVEHIALVRGDVSGDEPVLVRVHSECLTGDLFSSHRCDCGQQLDDALKRIAEAERGVLVYLRGHEGRGIGIGHKLAAYNLQDRGRDTIDANLDLGLPVDSRDYGVGAQILYDLGVQRIRLMTNNPAKYTGLVGYGLEVVERLPWLPRVTEDNIRYLATKRDRLGHDLPSSLIVNPTGTR